MAGISEPISGHDLDVAIAGVLGREGLTCQGTAANVAAPSFIGRLTREQLHRRMVRKAQRGEYDVRMHAYWGTDPKINYYCRQAVVRGTAAGLVPTSTRRYPVCETCSYHRQRNDIGEGRAVDLGVVARHVGPTPEGRRQLIAYQREEFTQWRQGHRPNMVELIGPDNRLVVLRWRWAPLPNGSALENQHDNHVHQAFVKQ